MFFGKEKKIISVSDGENEVGEGIVLAKEIRGFVHFDRTARQ